MAAINYKVVYSDDTDYLQTEVEKLLSRGWKLQGGVSISERTGTTMLGKMMFAQALVREPI